MSVIPALSSSNSSSVSFYVECTMSKVSRVIYTTYAVFNLLLLFPLYVFVLCMGVQRWRRQRSATISHSDFFTYHMMVVEVFCVVGAVLYTLGTYVPHRVLLLLGVYTYSIIFPGQALFHLLTCAERYVAVVHPVTYLRLRASYGVAVRNAGTACAWLFSFSWLSVTRTFWPEFPTAPLLCFLGVSLSAVFFCCLSVLWVLTRPGPGEAGGRGGLGDPSKLRAFHMIKHITAVLLLRFVGLLFCFGLHELVALSREQICVLMDSGVWLTVPSSLLLPLLFLHRAGKLSCCRRSTESG